MCVFSPEHSANSRLDLATAPRASLRPQDVRRPPGRQPERNLPRVPAPLTLLRLHGLPPDPAGRHRDVREANPVRTRPLLYALLLSKLLLVSRHLVRRSWKGF